MNAELRHYKRYRSTGVPWIGAVPEHWGMERAKWLYQKMARPVRDSDEIVTCFRDGIVTLRKNRRLDGFTNSLKEIGYQGVRRGDLVIHAMDAFAGAVGVSDSDGKSTPVYSVCTARRELDNRYYAYLIREMARSQWIMCLARGIRERSTDFRFLTFGAQTVPLPPVEEQRAIADYLDVNAVKVRRFIRNRQRLIEVLNEQKQAIINRAVICGLAPDVPFKPSGIDCLGDIPEHWVVKRLRHLIAGRLVNGLFKKKDQFGSGVRLVNVFDVYRDDFCIDPSTIDRVQVTESEKTSYEVQPGDIFFVRSSIKLEGTGRTAFVATCTEPIVFECHLVRARPLGTVINSRYLANYLNSVTVRNYLVSRANTVTISTIPQGVLKDIPVAFPPSKAQQNEILKAIDRQLHPIVEGIARAQREIELILEYRTRLISDVVTGKIDVRHLAPSPGSEDLEEAAEMLEPLEDDIDDVEMDEEEEINESD